MVLRLNYGLGYTETQQDITGATTILPPAELLPGRNVVYFLDQDSNGNHNIDFDAAFNFPDSFTQPITDAADKRRVLQFVTTYGNTLVYNQDYTTDVPSFPQDFFAYFPFTGGVGVDIAAYYTAILAVSGWTFGPFSVSADGLNHTGGTDTQTPIAAGAPTDFPQERTIAFWADVTAGGNQVRLQGSTGVFSRFYERMTAEYSYGSVYFWWSSYWYNSSTSSSAIGSIFTSPSLTGVHHFCVVRSVAGLQFYTDGVAGASSGDNVLRDKILAEPPGTFKDNDFRLRSNGSTGIDEIIIYNRALSSDEVLSLFDAKKAEHGL